VCVCVCVYVCVHVRTERVLFWWQGTQAEFAIKKYGDKDVHWSMQGMLRLMPAAMMRLFRPTLDNVKNAISQVISSPDVAGLHTHAHTHSHSHTHTHTHLLSVYFAHNDH